MVYCNQKVVLVDFKVFDSRSYPLFLDDELFHINVERRNGQYFYGLKMDKQADTPRNQARRLLEKKHWKQTMIFVALLAAAVTAVTILGQRAKPKPPGPSARAELIKYHGQLTEATVVRIYQHADKTTIRYQFEVQNQPYSGRMVLPPSEQAALENGMELREGDEFALQYVSDQPGVHAIRLDQPTARQLQRYRERAFQQHAKLHPGLSQSHIDCLLDIAFEIKGVNGYADLLFQTAPTSRNPHANELTYKRLLRSLDFRNASQQRCL